MDNNNKTSPALQPSESPPTTVPAAPSDTVPPPPPPPAPTNPPQPALSSSPSTGPVTTGTHSSAFVPPTTASESVPPAPAPTSASPQLPAGNVVSSAGNASSGASQPAQPSPPMQPLQLPAQSAPPGPSVEQAPAAQAARDPSPSTGVGATDNGANTQPATQPSPPPQGGAGGASGEGRVLRVEDALTYLDEVKRQFGDQPQIYNMFLEIMKSFKAEAIDTPGVIQKVSELFRGHPKLILGFNTFLPPGFRIEMSDILHDEAQHAAATQGYPPMPGAASLLHAQQMMAQQQQLMQQPVIIGPGGAPQMMMENFYLNPHQAYYEAQPHQYMMMMGGPEAAALQQQQLQQQQQQGQPGQPVEFDHAISYVTRIKRRFANDAETYKQFLDILHTYQKEQKSIKEVLDQVSELFKDHPDLLKEFTYFLPDGVREKAKQEINKIQNRRKKDEQRKAEKKEQQKPGPKGSRLEGREKPAAVSSMLPQMPASAGMKSLSPTSAARKEQGFGAQSDEQEEAGEKDARGERGISVTVGKIPRLEKRLFARIKAALNSRERWGEFLKCLELFSQEILSRQELIALATDMFASNTELLEEFDRLLASRGATDDATEDAWFSVPLSDIDFTQSRRCTPSYRSLPPNYPKPPCSERTMLCRMVLNDTWVAVPTGSEDFSFKGMRKNQYEEALFKCEDDRYELDMVIEANLSAIHALEPLAMEIEALNSQQKAGDTEMTTDSSSVPPPPPGSGAARFRLDRRTLSVIHLKAIARVYGDRATEVFELLRKSPASAIPIILGRLKAKDEEWRKLRTKMNDTWKDVLDKNYVKSLDHRSYYFKQNEKKLLLPKAMIAEARLGVSGDKPMSLEFPDAFAHRHAFALLSVSAEKSLTKADFDKFAVATEKIVSRLVGVKSFGGKAVTSTKVGTKVLSRYGLGTITAAAATGTASSQTCEVKLSASGSVIKVSKDDLLDAAPFNPKEMAVTGPSSSSATEILYVGQSGYLFLRFYHLLCDRIARAEALCMSLEREQRAQVKHPMDRNGAGVSTAAGEAQSVATGAEDTAAEEKSLSLFGKLLELVKQFVRGSIDQNRFEDEVYTTVGPNCYFLFTIDRLLNTVVRCAQGMIGEDRATKVLDCVAKYSEKKTATLAAEMYRACADALSVGNSCASAKIRVVIGQGPLSPPVKRPGVAAVEDPAIAPGDVPLAPMDAFWETSPQLVIEFGESIPQSVNFGPSAPRSFSPVTFDADGTPLTTEMGELELPLPVKIDLTKKTAGPMGAAEDSPAAPGRGGKKTEAAAVSGGSSNGGETTIFSMFTLERVPGSDDVFRRIANFKSDAGTDKDWWKVANQSDRAVSPAPDDSGSSNEEGPVGTSKRMRATDDNVDA